MVLQCPKNLTMDHTKLWGCNSASTALTSSGGALRNANYATNTLDKVLIDDYACKINKRILEGIEWPKFPDRYNILENVTDEELISEVKKRKIPVSKLTQPDYNWKHHRLVTNNLRYLI